MREIVQKNTKKTIKLLNLIENLKEEKDMNVFDYKTLKRLLFELALNRVDYNEENFKILLQKSNAFTKKVQLTNGSELIIDKNKDSLESETDEFLRLELNLKKPLKLNKGIILNPTTDDETYEVFFSIVKDSFINITYTISSKEFECFSKTNIYDILGNLVLYKKEIIKRCSELISYKYGYKNKNIEFFITEDETIHANSLNPNRSYTKLEHVCSLKNKGSEISSYVYIKKRTGTDIIKESKLLTTFNEKTFEKECTNITLENLLFIEDYSMEDPVETLENIYDYMDILIREYLNIHMENPFKEDDMFYSSSSVIDLFKFKHYIKLTKSQIIERLIKFDVEFLPDYKEIKKSGILDCITINIDFIVKVSKNIAVKVSINDNKFSITPFINSCFSESIGYCAFLTIKDDKYMLEEVEKYKDSKNIIVSNEKKEFLSFKHYTTDDVSSIKEIRNANIFIENGKKIELELISFPDGNNSILWLKEMKKDKVLKSIALMKENDTYKTNNDSLKELLKVDVVKMFYEKVYNILTYQFISNDVDNFILSSKNVIKDVFSLI